MRITQWGELGVLCRRILAERLRAGTATVSAAEMAGSLGIDLQYLQQIMQRLRKGGIVESVRGPQGGYRLARPPDEVSLRDILTAAEGDTFEIVCETKPVDEVKCQPQMPCNLRPIWFRLKEHINDFLEGYSLDRILDAQPDRSDPPPIQISRVRQTP